MTNDTTSDKLIATTRMSKSGDTKTKTQKKAASKKVVAVKKTVAKPTVKPAPGQTVNQPAGIQSTASIAGPESSHVEAIQHGRRIWPD